MLLTAALVTKHPFELFDRFENFVSTISARPYLSAVLIVGAATCARLALSPLLGTPQPFVADEISLMLQARTYLGGHLANHVRLLPDFESAFVLLSPTYASMYPVLKSLPLFVGLWLGIGAWGGVLLSMVALTLAVYWMAREWIDAKYAFIAALIVIIRFGLFSFWVNSYWGGALTALGGVLLLGGFKAVGSRPSLLNGALVGLGVVFLMTTRPYEGMFFAFPFGVALIVRLARSTARERKSAIPAGVAAAILVAAGFGLTAVHDQAVTGDWKISPYVLYRRTAGQVPFLLVQSFTPQSEGKVRYALARTNNDYEASIYNRRETWSGILSAETFRLRNYWNFYVGFALLIPFVVGIYALGGEPTVLLAAAALGVGLSFETFDYAHYASPGFGVVMLAIMAGFRRLRQWRPFGHPYGLSLSRTLPLALVIESVIPLSSALAGWPTFTLQLNTHTSAPCCWLRSRSLHVAVAQEVDRYEGRNLVIVDSGPKAPTGVHLVYNDPDIDDEKTIWINDDPEFNRLAIDRYPERRIWRLGWLDDGAACLQPFQTLSGPADALSDPGRLSPDPQHDWAPGSPDRCPGGLIRAPAAELS